MIDMARQRARNLFVVGYDDFNHERMKATKGGQRINFHALLSHPELQGREAYPVEVALRRCEDALRRFHGSIDAILGYWDFPVTIMLPLLCRAYGLPSSSLESVLKCEHKYWSRLEGEASVPGSVPAFRPVDPFSDESVGGIDLEPPYWLKPVKSTDSHLAFRIRETGDLEGAVPEIRRGIHHLARPFNFLLGLASLPEAVRGVDGWHCIAEKEVEGHQCTVEGYVHDREVHVRGIVDSFRYPGVPSFLRYQYPSRLSQRVKRRLTAISRTIVEQVGLDWSGWNIEFFVDEARDRISILEMNPRISQSHSHMFELVDGASNLEIPIALALGRKPDLPSGEGRFDCAAKFYLRTFEDATVIRIPTRKEIAQLQERFPGTLVHLTVEEGTRLSELWGQDSFSYRVAEIHMGGHDTEDLISRFLMCRDLLPIRFSPDDVALAPLEDTAAKELVAGT